MSKHTQLPWKTHAVDDCSIVNNDGNFAASTFFIDADDYEENYERREADAAFIVKAVNSHAALTEAVKVLSEALENVSATYVSKPSKIVLSEAQIIQVARSALSRAKELVK